MCGLLAAIKRLFLKMRRSSTQHTRPIISAPTNFHRSAANLPGQSMHDVAAEHQQHVYELEDTSVPVTRYELEG
ncbi:hypothetical protein MMC11_003084 [Xylographa trunciseda]|nr:hypothetical protein [Xylographa trunciseda]